MRNRSKSAYLMIILIISALLFQSRCMITNDVESDGIPYDIRGDWTINLAVESFSWKFGCTFTGTKKEGTVIPEDGNPTTYHVGGAHGLEVSFTLWLPMEEGDDYYEFFRGAFVNENYMEGTGDFIAWGAVRKEIF